MEVVDLGTDLGTLSRPRIIYEHLTSLISYRLCLNLNLRFGETKVLGTRNVLIG